MIPSASNPHSLAIRQRSLFDEPVRDAEADNMCLVIVIGHEFQYCTSQATGDSAVFHGYDFIKTGENFMKQFFIDGF